MKIMTLLLLLRPLLLFLLLQLLLELYHHIAAAAVTADTENQVARRHKGRGSRDTYSCYNVPQKGEAALFFIRSPPCCLQGGWG